METNDSMIVIPVLIGFFVIFGGVFAAILFSHFQKIKKIRNQKVDFDGASVSVPLLAAFIGLKVVPFFSFGYNNLNPKLRFFSDHLEFKCFRTQRRAYSEIQCIEVLRAKSLATQNLELHFKNSSFKYIFNVVNAETLRKALEFLENKGCVLSPQAQNLAKGQK